ncbi:MAG: terminase family protein [Planctomycetes bacterium]|nr:terminase family protein [Planctomycetota bacterium]
MTTSLTSHAIPTTPDALHATVHNMLQLSLPRRAVLPGHASAFAFLAHAFLAPAGHSPQTTSPDSVLWAARGAGKTFLGALLVLLDLLFRPGISVRILSGSLAQSLRMYQHLKRFLHIARLEDHVDGKLRAHGFSLSNGSHVEVLAQSETSIRGTRVQRIVCDEVDLFTPSLFDAAQLVTRSATCAGHHIHGSVICLSTLHRPHGVMTRLIADCAASTRTLFKWSVIDSLERCPTSRACTPDTPNPDANAIPLPVLESPPPQACPLHNDCQGRAKHINTAEPGHYFIADAISLKARVSIDTWKSEMLCQGISRADAVYDRFRVETHVIHSCPLESRFRRGHRPDQDSTSGTDEHLSLVCGMDFGVRNPSAILWGILDTSIDRLPKLYIIDELHTVGELTEVNARRIMQGRSANTDTAPEGMRWKVPASVAIDPAGQSRTSNSAFTDAAHLRTAGLTTISPDNTVDLGIGAVRALISPASGPPRLLIHSRCTRLINDLLTYRYNPDRPHSDTPVKDGPDHSCDALRYMVMALGRRPSKNERTECVPF